MAEHFGKQSGDKKANQREKRATPARDEALAPFEPARADLLDWQGMVGNQGVQTLLAQRKLAAGPGGTVQTKLTVGDSDDAYEQEADAVAQKVMNMQVPAPSISSPGEGAVARQVDEEEEEELQMQETEEEEEEVQMQAAEEEAVQMQEEEEEEELLQAKAEDGGVVGGALETRIQGAKGSGQPLAESARGFFEPRFGTDFSDVQVHTGAEADTLNRAMSARAFTTGKDIFFRDGEYNPDSAEGRELLAHELTHVAQQTGGAADVSRMVDAQIQRLTINTPGAGMGLRVMSDDDSSVTINPDAAYWVSGESQASVSFGESGQVASLTLSPGTDGILQLRFNISFFIDNSTPWTNIEYSQWAFAEWPVRVEANGDLVISDPLPVRYEGTQPQTQQLYVGSIEASKGADYVQGRVNIVSTTQHSRTGAAGYEVGQSMGGQTYTRDFRVNIVVPRPEVPPPTTYLTAVHFDPGDDTIEEGGERHIVDWYNGLPGEARQLIETGSLPVTIEGHASTTQPGPANRELSRRRADRVEQILRDYAGSDAHLRKFARGEYQAWTGDEVEDDTERRVDLSVEYDPSTAGGGGGSR
ncbi:MAG: DUF4157 domain-containing protein [Anaerolineae bacterium]|nr:DUF4157 domain-containing protein [Anaerolineae bacterium]